ncbi:Pr6Pr family membrane protein [Panacibacter sp. DH6]|uniref:Pr6Pr family membrane protein n=1 Tax=Panacibacter microcysteis TaxID=2793269 RepID=A0A931E9P3_9BACT|nr:Pr6Pr family membrane protein [Panacibacter microcysteis]MBG9377753.1 Pr6Pr family membrane protein [Panacibacter microcysteis]
MLPFYSGKEKAIRIFLFVISFITIVAQFWLTVTAAGTEPMLTRIVRFFSFMTILTNILVALAYVLPLAAPSSKAGRFFAKPNTQSAILVYIIVVCLGYHFLLANVWKPEGLQYWVDKSLHYLVPFLYLLFYLVFVVKGTLAFNNVYRWLIYPTVYLVYAMTRGAITGDYPYPFLNLHTHEASKVYAVIAVLFAVYISLSLIVVAFDRLMGKRSALAQTAR